MTTFRELSEASGITPAAREAPEATEGGVARRGSGAAARDQACGRGRIRPSRTPVRRRRRSRAAAERRLGVVAAQGSRLEGGGLDLDFDLAPLVLASGVGRVVGEHVLAAKLLV